MFLDRCESLNMGVIRMFLDRCKSLKKGVIRMFLDRCESFMTEEEGKKQINLALIKNALTRYGYPQ